MISLPLLKQSIKSNGMFLAVITIVLTVLNIEFATIPDTKPMLFIIFYGMMTLIVPSIYVLVTSNKLLSNQVDRGSMAYILSNPIKRSTVVITQAVYFIASTSVMFIVNTIASVIANQASIYDLKQVGAGFSGNLTTEMIFQLNLSAFAVMVALAGLTFMFSGIFNLSKYATAFAGTIVGVSILAKIMALFGTMGVKPMANFKYLTFGTLFDSDSILMSVDNWLPKMISAFVIGLIGFMIGSIWFTKKDLPL